MNATAIRNVWILGGTSAIALAYARLLAANGAKLVLLGRNAAHLAANAADLAARGAAAADFEVIDLVDEHDHRSRVAALTERHGPPDEVVIAYGMLGDQGKALADNATAREIIEVGFVSVALWLLALRAAHEATRPLTLVVIGSVAGDRGRASNFVYGAAKGGLERFVEGFQHAEAGSSIHALLVKPGFVDTPMTAAFDKRGPLWTSPDKVAGDIARSVRRGKAVVYTPWFWWVIMTIIRALPRFLFNRIKL